VNPQQYNVDVLEIGVNQVTLAGKLGGQVITKNRLEGQSAAMEQLQSNVFAEQREKRDSYISKSSMLTRKAPAPVQKPTLGKQERADVAKAKPYLMGDSMNTLGLSEFVEFPSRDGFKISLDMSVEMELLPSDIAAIYSRYGDLPALVDKIIMPQITSISRNKGSEYRAKDFIVGEGREKFQNDLTAALAATLGEKKIVVHNALIRHVVVPEQILDPIQQASIAIEQDLTNKERQTTAKKEAELNTEVSLIDQRRMQVEQETQKLKAEIRADQEKQVAEIKADTTKRGAEIQKDTAVIAADTVRLLAIANADSLKLVEGARADGFRLKAEAFKDPQAFTYWEMAKNLNPNLKVNILHAGEGTLWTDIENATLGDLGGTQLLKK
jgi:regulator of protease activity HflC (stomatin/prohibitin superfamily)